MVSKQTLSCCLHSIAGALQHQEPDSIEGFSSMHPTMHQDPCHSVITAVTSALRQVIRQHSAASPRALNAISWRHGIRSCTPTPHQKTSQCVRPTLPSWRVVTLAPTQEYYGRMAASAELTWLTNGIARFQVCTIWLCKHAAAIGRAVSKLI